MKRLRELIAEFWIWTQLPIELWDKIDISTLPSDSIGFPKIGEICDECISLVNCPLTPDEMDRFLLCMAIDSEDEDILEYCMDHARSDFLHSLISAGVAYPQSHTRWQIAELLRNDVPDRYCFLGSLLADPHPYVRKRAKNVMQELTDQ